MAGGSLAYDVDGGGGAGPYQLPFSRRMDGVHWGARGAQGD
jgi:hypothetical protein